MFPRCRRQVRLLLAILTFTLLVTFILYGRDPPRVKARFAVGRPSGVSPFVTTFPRAHGNAERSNRPKVKTILLWTQYFGSKTWGAVETTFWACPVKNCRVTQDKTEVKDADALMMNIRDFSSVSDLPAYRSPQQVWILHSSEPPYYLYLKLDKLRNVFNWTSWYRSDADIFSPYGTYSLINSSSQTNIQKQVLPDAPIHQSIGIAPDELNPFIPKSLSPGDLLSNSSSGDVIPPDPFAQHDLLVFWAASSCLNYNQRYKFVGELRRHLPVDTYGSCGELTCAIGTDECRTTLRRYKFVLAFENGYCRDYITEKYWNALKRNQIPIVMGGADYSKLAIPGSYIDVDNFTSVEDLASFVLSVSNDRDLYNSFHAWRAVYKKNTDLVLNWCQLCQALHDQSRPAQAYRDLKGWVSQDTCPLQSNSQFFVWGKTYYLYKLFGI